MYNYEISFETNCEYNQPYSIHINTDNLSFYQEVKDFVAGLSAQYELTQKEKVEKKYNIGEYNDN